MKRLIMAGLFMVAAASLFAATHDVVVLYDGRTEVNFEALRFMQRAFQSQGSSISMVVTNNASAIKPGAYDAVVVLNTGVTQGVDSTLASFVESYSAPDEIILVTLLSRSNQIFVNVERSEQNQYGVDAITSASTWGSRRGGNDVVSMHEQWMSDLIDLIQGRA